MFLSLVSLLLAGVRPIPVFAEAETIDLKTLAKKARPAVMLLVVSDSRGGERVAHPSSIVKEGAPARQLHDLGGR